MPQEASGNVSLSTNPSGVGAVYFDKAVDYHAENLRRFDDNMERQRQEDAANRQNTAKLFADLKLDTQGILDTDTQYFQDRIKGLHDFQVQGLKAGFDISKPAAGAWYSQYKKMYDQLQLDMKVSANQRDQIAVALKEATDKGGNVPQTQDNAYRFASMPFEQRNKTADWTKIYVQSTPNLIEDIDKNWNSVKENIVKVRERIVEKDGNRYTEKQEYIPDESLWDLANSELIGNGYKVDQVWNSLSPTDQAFYADLAKTKKMVNGSPVEPKEAMIYQMYKPRAQDKVSTGDVAFTPERGESAKGVIDQKNSDALYEIVQGIEELNPEVFDKAPNGQPYLMDSKYLVSTKLAGVLYGTRQKGEGTPAKDENGNIIYSKYVTAPNRIVSLRVDRANPNIYELRTDQDVADDPTGTQYSIKIPKSQFAQGLWTSNFKDAPTAARTLQQSAKKFKDVTKAGIVEPTLTTTTKTTVNPTKKVTLQGTVKGYTKEGAPIYENVKQQPANKKEDLRKKYNY